MSRTGKLLDWWIKRSVTLYPDANSALAPFVMPYIDCRCCNKGDESTSFSPFFEGREEVPEKKHNGPGKKIQWWKKI
jgi:hypothetical protein